MAVQTASELTAKKCKPCEGGVNPIPGDEAAKQVSQLAGWSITSDGKKIRKEWSVKNFMAGIKFFHDIAQIAEGDNHHPDLHLTGYRNVAVELTTHAIGGISENDFILAAKIDELPVELKKQSTN
jgi:4a-hydroxytetrahydrobiopterin dehydratase